MVVRIGSGWGCQCSPSRSSSRCRTSAVATDRLSESAQPWSGRYTRLSAAASIVGDAPVDSVPITIANDRGSCLHPHAIPERRFRSC